MTDREEIAVLISKARGHQAGWMSRWTTLVHAARIFHRLRDAYNSDIDVTDPESIKQKLAAIVVLLRSLVEITPTNVDDRYLKKLDDILGNSGLLDVVVVIIQRLLSDRPELMGSVYETTSPMSLADILTLEEAQAIQAEGNYFNEIQELVDTLVLTS